jgi:SAM-dependent methyltransferase
VWQVSSIELHARAALGGAGMRDVVTGFYLDVLRRLLAAGAVAISDSVLVICGGPLDDQVTAMAGFRNVTVSNLDDAVSSSFQDAENLTYGDGSFDFVIVHAGLHHCHSPHRALLEMYRVARKCAVAFEARDSLLMQTAIRWQLTEDYERSAISLDGMSGGVANTGIPNFIYRWTEREVTKTIASFDPAHVPDVRFFYDMRLPLQRFARSGNRVLQAIGMIIEPLSQVFAALLPKQCNEFAFAIMKSGLHQPWIKD